jgi:hypothetical protein
MFGLVVQLLLLLLQFPDELLPQTEVLVEAVLARPIFAILSHLDIPRVYAVREREDAVVLDDEVGLRQLLVDLLALGFGLLVVDHILEGQGQLGPLPFGLSCDKVVRCLGFERGLLSAKKLRCLVSRGDGFLRKRQWELGAVSMESVYDMSMRFILACSSVVSFANGPARLVIFMSLILLPSGRLSVFQLSIY